MKAFLFEVFIEGLPRWIIAGAIWYFVVYIHHLLTVSCSS